MKIKKNTPYEIMYHVENPDARTLNRKTHQQKLNEALYMAQVTEEEYNQYKDTVRIENIAGSSVPLKEYVQNLIFDMEQAEDRVEKEINLLLKITYVFPKKNYSSEETFLNSKNPDITAIRELPDFIEFVGVREETDDVKFFIGHKIIPTQLDEILYYNQAVKWNGHKIILMSIDENELKLISTEYNISPIETIVIGRKIIVDGVLDVDQTNAPKFRFDQYIQQGYVPMTPIIFRSAYGIDTTKYRIDEEKNIFINTDLADLKTDMVNPDDFEEVNGKWVRVGKLVKDQKYIDPYTGTAMEIGGDEPMQEQKYIPCDEKDVMSKLESIFNQGDQK